MLAAARSTSWVSMSSFSKRMASAFTRAIFKSRWVFSMTFAASATLMLPALWVPALIMVLYRASTLSVVAAVEPDVTLTTLVRAWLASPGLILSGL